MYGVFEEREVFVDTSDVNPNSYVNLPVMKDGYVIGRVKEAYLDDWRGIRLVLNIEADIEIVTDNNGEKIAVDIKD